LTVSATTARTAGRIRQVLGSQIAGVALAVLMVQQSAARGRQRHSDD
jgi:hypothetical protein